MLTAIYTFWSWYSHNLSSIVSSCKPFLLWFLIDFFLLFAANTLSKIKLKKCSSSQLPFTIQGFCKSCCENEYFRRSLGNYYCCFKCRKWKLSYTYHTGRIYCWICYEKVLFCEDVVANSWKNFTSQYHAHVTCIKPTHEQFYYRENKLAVFVNLWAV